MKPKKVDISLDKKKRNAHFEIMVVQEWRGPGPEAIAMRVGPEWDQHVDQLRLEHYMRSRLHTMGHEI